MTTPNDAPRPTSELVKRRDEVKRRLRIQPGLSQTSDEVCAFIDEAAASLQALEARNKELNEVVGLLLNCPYPEYDNATLARARAALHPATKTGET